jgi:hypothetical protein
MNPRNQSKFTKLEIFFQNKMILNKILKMMKWSNKFKNIKNSLSELNQLM